MAGKGIDKFKGSSFEKKDRGVASPHSRPHPLEDPSILTPRIHVREIDLGLIDPNPEQPRMVFEEGSLNGLASSIMERGVLQPILLSSKKDGRFLILAGERRYKASVIAGRKTIPSIVKEYEDPESVSLIENLQRENLSPVEECLAIKRLVDVTKKRGGLQKEVSSVIGKDESYVSQSLKAAAFIEKYGNREKLLSLKMSNGSRLSREHLVLIAYRPSLEEGKALLDKILKDSHTVKSAKQTVSHHHRQRDIIQQLIHFRGKLKVDFLQKEPPENKELYIKELGETLATLEAAGNSIKNAIEKARG